MLPTMRHRVTIFAAVILAALVWSVLVNPLTASDGGSGLTLINAGVGLPLAVALVALVALPAFGLGAFAAAVGHPLSGVFIVCASLAVLAGLGGPIDGWLHRMAGPSDYSWLIVEVLIWNVGLMVLVLGINALRPAMRRWAKVEELVDSPANFALPRASGVAGGLVCAMVSGVLAFFLIRNSDAGQVMWSLVLAFTVGSLLGQMAFPDDNGVAVLLSPGLVAVAVYAFVIYQFGSKEQLLAAWYTLNAGGNLPGLALALPIHYVSAAVAGCTLGIGMAQGLDMARPRPAVA